MKILVNWKMLFYLQIAVQHLKFQKVNSVYLAAVVLIMAGCYILLENVFYMFRIIFGLEYNWWVTEIIFDYFPRFVFAAVIILAGLYLIKGKKIQLDNNDEYSKTDKDVL